MSKEYISTIRAGDKNPPAQFIKLSIPVNVDINHHRLEDLITLIELWLIKNTEHKWSIEIVSSYEYKIPVIINVFFEDKDDATIYKLSHLWSEEFNSTTIECVIANIKL